MNKTPALKVPLQTELRFHLRRYEQPHTIGGPAEQQTTDDFCSKRPNNSSDDLRVDAAAMRPMPTSPLEGRGRAEGRRVEGQSAGGTDYLVGGETSSGCHGGRWHRKRPKPLGPENRTRGSCQRHERRTPFPPIAEGRSGPLPAQRPTPTRRTPLPSTDDEHP
jgi:hypothetical protein